MWKKLWTKSQICTTTQKWNEKKSNEFIIYILRNLSIISLLLKNTKICMLFFIYRIPTHSLILPHFLSLRFYIENELICTSLSILIFISQKSFPTHHGFQDFFILSIFLNQYFTEPSVSFFERITILNIYIIITLMSNNIIEDEKYNENWHALTSPADFYIRCKREEKKLDKKKTLQDLNFNMFF